MHKTGMKFISININPNSAAVLLVMLILGGTATGRTWTAIDGRTTEAELKSYDSASSKIVLVTKGGREFTLEKSQLSDMDQTYLDQWEAQRLENEKQEKEKFEAENAKAGTVISYHTDGKNKLSYYCYYPKNYTYQKKLPMLILFDPGGNGRGIMNAFKAVGDAHDWLIVGCDGLKNGLDDQLGKEWFAEMLPHIENSIPHNAEELYMGGMSGGAERAYHYSALFDRPWKGIVACGGWLGGSEYSDLKYRRKMAVAIINGDNDANANSWIEKDSSVAQRPQLQDQDFPVRRRSRNCTAQRSYRSS